MTFGWALFDTLVSEELVKVQQHLTLLRSEYVKLQARFQELERSQALSSAGTGKDGTSFAANIMRKISGLFGQSEYRQVTFWFLISWLLNYDVIFQ